MLRIFDSEFRDWDYRARVFFLDDATIHCPTDRLVGACTCHTGMTTLCGVPTHVNKSEWRQRSRVVVGSAQLAAHVLFGQ